MTKQLGECEKSIWQYYDSSKNYRHLTSFGDSVSNGKVDDVRGDWGKTIPHPCSSVVIFQFLTLKISSLVFPFLKNGRI